MGICQPCHCCGSEKLNTGEKSKQEDFDFEETGVDCIDQIFGAAKELLETFVDLRDSLSNTYTRLRRTTRASLLKEPTLEDSVFAMLYAYSAGTNGDLQEVGFTLDIEAPFVKVDEGSLRSEHQPIANAWNEFVGTLMEAGPKLAELSGQIQDAVDACADAPERVKGEVSDLGPFDSIKAIKATADNCVKLKDAPKAVQTSIEFQARLAGELHALATGKLQESRSFDEVKAIGRQAHSAGVFEPSMLIQNYWPDKVQLRSAK